VDSADESPSVLMGYRIDIADDLALAVTLEIAETREQLAGQKARTIRQLLMTGFGASTLGQDLLSAARAIAAVDAAHG
jgi:hypothetical protein